MICALTLVKLSTVFGEPGGNNCDACCWMSRWPKRVVGKRMSAVRLSCLRLEG